MPSNIQFTKCLEVLHFSLRIAGNRLFHGSIWKYLSLFDSLPPLLPLYKCFQQEISNYSEHPPLDWCGSYKNNQSILWVLR